MSIAATTWAWRQQTGTSSAKAVLVALADITRRDADCCWPSRARLAALTELHPDTIRRAIRELEVAGLVEVEARYSDAGRRQGTLYKLKLGGGAESGGAPAQHGEDPRTARGTTPAECGPNRGEGTDRRTGGNSTPSQDKAGAARLRVVGGRRKRDYDATVRPG